MADFMQSEESQEKKVGKDLDKGMPKKKEQVELMFRQNRRYELKIGRTYLIFEGRQKMVVDKSMIEHPDFTPEIAKYFVVQWVK